MEIWICLGFAGCLTLGIVIGVEIGKGKARAETAHFEAQKQATQMWMEYLKGGFGEESE